MLVSQSRKLSLSVQARRSELEEISPASASTAKSARLEWEGAVVGPVQRAWPLRYACETKPQQPNTDQRLERPEPAQ